MDKTLYSILNLEQVPAADEMDRHSPLEIAVVVALEGVNLLAKGLQGLFSIGFISHRSLHHGNRFSH